jgi:hypothetical protein
MEIRKLWLAPRGWRSGNWARFWVELPQGGAYTVELQLQARMVRLDESIENYDGPIFDDDVLTGLWTYDDSEPLFVTELRVRAAFEGQRVTTARLRDLSLARLVSIVNEPDHLEILLMNREDDDVDGEPESNEWIEIDLSVSRSIEDLCALIKAVPAGFRITDAPRFWETFAAAWMTASRKTRGPAKLLSEELGVDGGRVRGWAKQARDKGLMPSSTGTAAGALWGR